MKATKYLIYLYFFDTLGLLTIYSIVIYLVPISYDSFIDLICFTFDK